MLVIEGAKEAEAEENPLNSLTVAEHVDKYIADGLSQKDAIKRAAADRNAPKRDIYNEYHNIGG